MEQKKALKYTIVLSILAIILFSYLVNVHYKIEEKSFCDISSGVSCDIVNKSLYSETFGIPVALLGAITFAIVLLLSILALRNKNTNILGVKFTKKNLLLALLIILSISVLFSLWLIYAELFLILSICILCVVSDIVILTTLFIIISLNKNNVNKNILNLIKIFGFITAALIIYLLYKIVLEIY